MRDAEIIGGMGDLNKKVALNYRQTVFLDARLQAMEKVFQNGWNALLFVFFPKAVMQKVNDEHMQLMREHDDALFKAIQEQKRKANGIQVIPAGVANAVKG